MAVEITLIAPWLMMVLLLVAVVIHRGVDARLRLDDVAHQAARAASIERSAAAADAAARATVADALSAAGVVCRPITVTTDTTNLAPGGTVTVSVSCSVDFTDALILGVSSQKTVSATATEPVDTWRSSPVNAMRGTE